MSDSASNSGNILVVDDNAFNRELALELLQDTHASIDTADDGKNAVAQANIKSYDFILMDIQMPIMDGFEATKIIKNKDPNQIVIALTANAIKGDKERFMAAGFDDYLSKPVEATKLYDMLQFWSRNIGSGSEDQSNICNSNKATEVPDKEKSSAPTGESLDLKTEQAAQVSDLESYDDSIIPVEYRGLQVEKALKMVGDKHSLYFKLMKLFSDNYKNTANELLRALQDEDSMTAGRIVHTIKGSASNLGAENLRQIAVELEESISNHGDEMQAHVTQFCARLDETIVIMDEFVQRYQHLSVR